MTMTLFDPCSAPPCSLKRENKERSLFSTRSLFRSWPLLMTLALSGTPGIAGGLPEQNPTSPSSATPKLQPTHINVREVKSNKGITAWMVEAHEIPVVSVAIAFKNAGNAADPKNLSGLVHMLSSMLDEGAGPWNTQEFKKFLLEKNIELSISSSQDTFQLSFRTIRKNVGEAFHLLNTILTQPRFDEVSLARVKNQLLTLWEQSLHNENFLAAQKVNSLVYGDHPYGKTAQQILKEFPNVTADHMRQFIKDRFTRDQLLISAVGDITAEELKGYLDKTFGDFPEKATPTDVKEAPLLNIGVTAVEPLDIPQSLIYFIQRGISRNDPDFYATFIMMKILGDGQFESRLWNEVREKRGLAYGIDADLNWSQHSALIVGNTATKNTNVKEVIAIIRKSWEDMLQGTTEAELDFVKKRMIGSFALNFSSTLRITKALLIYQIDNLGVDYINKRNEFLASVTLEQINKAAKSLLNPEQLTFVVVGKPEGLPCPEALAKSTQKSTQEKNPGVHK